VETVEVAPGLWRWTAVHPRSAAWPVDARDERPWPEEIGCVYLEAPDAALARPDELEATLAELTALPVERLLVSHGEPVLENARERMAEAVALAGS
jgi:hypothetical protein